MFDRLVRALLPFAYRASILWERLSGRRRAGAAVAVWYGGRILLVRHSYRRGYGLPGGAMKPGETPEAAAARELREEVGIEAQPEELVLALSTPRWHVLEYFPDAEPVPKPDRREITEARFMHPTEARGHSGLHRYFRARFGPPRSEAAGAKPPDG